MKSIYAKFVLITLAIITSSALIGFLIANSYYQRSIKPVNDSKNMAILQSVTGFLDKPDQGKVELGSYLETIASVGYQLALVDEQGRETYYGAAYKDKKLEDEVKRKVVSGELYHGMAEFPRETFVTGFFANELRNTVGAPLTYQGAPYALFLRPDIKLLFSELHILIGWMTAILILASIALVLVTAKFLVSPIAKLTAATKDIRSGNFDIRLDITRGDELGTLAKSFEDMSQRLSQLDAMRTEFVSHVSHDFQSPLQTIQGYTQLLAREGLSVSEKEGYLRTIREETSRLSLLTKQLLLLTSLDKEESLCRPVPYNVADQLKEIARKYMWLLDEKDITLSYTLPDTRVEGDPALLYNVWENLLTNAVKYNRPGGDISIVLSERPDEVEIAVQDSGIGMTEGEQDRIFDRFYRADQSRTRAVEGTGLGLSIVQSIVRLHHGTVTVASEPEAGTTFVVTLPKRKESHVAAPIPQS